MLTALLITALLMQAPGAPLPTPQPELTAHEGEWIVESIDRIKILPDSRVTIQIAGQNVSGVASCNSYRGAMTLDETTINLGELLRTMKVCDEARMSEERDFFPLLRDVVRLEREGQHTLRLVTADGRSITARRK